jgi:hypothetical protein
MSNQPTSEEVENINNITEDNSVETVEEQNSSNTVETEINSTEEGIDLTFLNLLNSSNETHSEKQWILENFLEIGNTVLIKSDSGVGLTWLLTALSLGVARQTKDAKAEKKTNPSEFVFNHFRTVTPVDVTYCEGALSTDRLLERVKLLIDKELKFDCKINLLCREGRDISFFDEETRLRLEGNFRDNHNHMVIYDSLHNLFSRYDINSKTNEKLSFTVLDWIKKLRDSKVTQIFVEPKGNGRNSLRIPNDIIDIVIEVNRLSNPLTLEMKIVFLKSRYTESQNQIPFHLLLEKDGKSNNKLNLEYQDDTFFYTRRVLELSKEGIPQNKIAKELGKHQSTISRWLAKSLPSK